MSSAKQTYRVILIGDSNVGKTCIINKFIRGTFDAEETPTVGGFYDSYSEVYENQVIELQIWDTAGQEQYRSLGPLYYRGAAAAILVFDITSRVTFNSLSEWAGAFRSTCGDDSILIVAGNKSDLSNRTVLIQEAKKWAEDNECSYLETSAKTGQGIKEIFSQLITSLVNSNQSQTQHTPVEENKTGGCC